MALKLIQGKQIDVNLTGSFTGSFTGNLTGTSSYATNAATASLAPNYTLTSSFQDFTSSYYQDSSSFDTRIDSLEQFSSSLDATFATDAQLNAATASLSSSISSLSSSFTIFSGSYNTGSFTGSFSGSFSGSGANLFNIPASGIVGLNLSQISSGSVSASISPNSGLQINTNVTATSFTGSLRGTASFAVSSSTTITSSYALSSSFASTASFAPNYTLTSSFNQFTQSYYQDSSSFDNRINELPISQLLREEFTWTSGSSQIFQLLSTASQVYSVEVQGQGALSQTQYVVTGSNRVQILDQLQSNDYVVILYTNSTTGFQPYYSQAQVDGLVNNKELLSNKATNLTNPNNTTYPTTLAVNNSLSSLFSFRQGLISLTSNSRTLRYYNPVFGGNSVGTVGIPTNRLHITPFLIEKPTVILGIAQAASNAGTLRMGIYSGNVGELGTINLVPGTEVNTPVTSATYNLLFTSPVTLQPGIYWIAMVGGLVTLSINTYPNVTAWNPLLCSSNIAGVAGGSFEYMLWAPVTNSSIALPSSIPTTVNWINQSRTNAPTNPVLIMA
jgi:hypothetical protein